MSSIYEKNRGRPPRIPHRSKPMELERSPPSSRWCCARLAENTTSIHQCQRTPQRVSAVLAWTSRLATLVIALVAVLISIVAWGHYVMAPWTRDGRIRAQVASVAPLVSGQITEVKIADNQFVHKGDVLYVIDPFDFEVALRTNMASLKQRAADQQVKEAQSERRLHLSDLATTPEQQQTYK